jgi:hypothetical protein
MLAWFAVLGVERLDGVTKRSISPAAASAASQEDALAGFHEVRQEGAGLALVGDRAGRDWDEQILALGAGLVLATARLARRRAEVNLLVEGDQGVGLGIGDEVDVTALAPIAAAGAAARNVRFSPEGDDAVPTIARLDVDARLVEEHGARIHAMLTLVN